MQQIVRECGSETSDVLAEYFRPAGWLCLWYVLPYHNSILYIDHAWWSFTLKLISIDYNYHLKQMFLRFSKLLKLKTSRTSVAQSFSEINLVLINKRFLFYLSVTKRKDLTDNWTWHKKYIIMFTPTTTYADRILIVLVTILRHAFSI